MNKLYKYSTCFVLAIVLSVAGCTDLTENPVSILSPGSFYKSEADFNAAINGAMAELYGNWGAFDFVGPFLLSMGAEDLSTRSTEDNLYQYDNFTVSVNLERTASMWGRIYGAVNAANQIITSIPEATELDDTSKRYFEGQARYIRAFSYFYLTRWWGEVPIITVENQLDAENVGQSPVSDVYNVIVEDLKVAEEYLPPTFPENARPTQGAAKTLLAEVYLTMAGWPLEDASYYPLARDKAKEVMDMQMYSLEENYGDLWVNANKFSTSEWIFFLNGSAGSGATASHYHPATRPSEEGGWNDFMSEARYLEAFPEGPRKEATFWTVINGDLPWQQTSIGKPFIAKFRDSGSGSAKVGPILSNNGDGFFPVSRYAEVLLMYAEAANMAEGGPSQAAYDAINEVRDRAGGYDENVYGNLTSGLTQAEFDAAVIEERAWEFGFETKRWFDLVRKKMIVEVNQDLFPNVTTNNRWHPKPQIQVDLVNGLEQNPGY